MYKIQWLKPIAYTEFYFEYFNILFLYYLILFATIFYMEYQILLYLIFHICTNRISYVTIMAIICQHKCAVIFVPVKG